MNFFLLNVRHMINLHSFRKSGSSMCSVVGKNPGVKSSVAVGPMGAGSQQEAKRLRRSEAEAADPESDVGSEGSSTKGEKGRHLVGMGFFY